MNTAVQTASQPDYQISSSDVVTQIANEASDKGFAAGDQFIADNPINPQDATTIDVAMRRVVELTAETLAILEGVNQIPGVVGVRAAFNSLGKGAQQVAFRRMLKLLQASA